MAAVARGVESPALREIGLSSTLLKHTTVFEAEARRRSAGDERADQDKRLHPGAAGVTVCEIATLQRSVALL